MTPRVMRVSARVGAAPCAGATISSGPLTCSRSAREVADGAEGPDAGRGRGGGGLEGVLATAHDRLARDAVGVASDAARPAPDGAEPCRPWRLCSVDGLTGTGGQPQVSGIIGRPTGPSLPLPGCQPRTCDSGGRRAESRGAPGLRAAVG
jgi:hypothetical protein